MVPKIEPIHVDAPMSHSFTDGTDFNIGQNFKSKDCVLLKIEPIYVDAPMSHNFTNGTNFNISQNFESKDKLKSNLKQAAMKNCKWLNVSMRIASGNYDQLRC